MKRQPWATRETSENAPSNNPAGRVFTFNERTEQQVANTMRDVDEMRLAIARLYPNDWTRAEFIQLFFLDSATTQLQEMLDRVNEDDS